MHICLIIIQFVQISKRLMHFWACVGGSTTMFYRLKWWNIPLHRQRYVELRTTRLFSTDQIGKMSNFSTTFGYISVNITPTDKFDLSKSSQFHVDGDYIDWYDIDLIMILLSNLLESPSDQFRANYTDCSTFYMTHTLKWWYNALSHMSTKSFKYLLRYRLYI